MKIFLATSFLDKELFARYRDFLREHGHDVYDWTDHKPIRPFKENQQLTRQYAVENATAIVEADIFILIADERSRSSYVELGVALNSHTIKGTPHIYIIGNYESMYFLHPSISHAHSIEQILAEQERQAC